MKKKILVFDLDGTIVDSTEAHAKAFNLAFKKNNLVRLPETKIIRVFGPPAEDVIKKLYPAIGKRRLDAVAKDKKDFLKQTAHYTKSLPGILETLEKLKKKYILVLISNSTHNEIIELLDEAKINPNIFKGIFGSIELGHHKPDPYVIKHIEKMIKAKVEYIIGDTIYDIRTGKNAGIKTIAVLTGIHDIKTLGKEEPTLIIKSLSLLPDIID
jgi:phosphoglycolate phosphatase